MKSKIFTTILFTLSVTIALAVTNTTTGDGDWEGNIWTPGLPGLDLRNSSRNVIVGSGHDVTLGTTVINKNLTLSANNGKFLLIRGTLIINGNLIVTGNNWSIVVEPGAVFTVTGNVMFNSPGDGNSAPEANINGTMGIGGSLSGTGSVSGTGTLTVNGSIGGAISINPGVNVIGTSSTYCPPTNLRGDVNFNVTHYSVILTWRYNSTCSAIEFEIRRTLGTTVTTRRVGMTKSDTEFSWHDNAGDLSGGSTPLYEVRAVYPGGIRSTAVTLSFANQPLPIELMYFNVQAINNTVNVMWATAAEINNNYFTIERSIDGAAWEVVSFVNGAGNTNHVMRYEFTDLNPIEGISYYRLKQTDFDGQYEYFAPVAVNNTSNKKSSEIVNVAFNSQKMDIWVSNETEGAVLVVADIQGRLLAQYTLMADDYVQNVSVNFPRSYRGEVVMVRLISNDKSDEKKYLIRY